MKKRILGIWKWIKNHWKTATFIAVLALLFPIYTHFKEPKLKLDVNASPMFESPIIMCTTDDWGLSPSIFFPVKFILTNAGVNAVVVDEAWYCRISPDERECRSKFLKLFEELAPRRYIYDYLFSMPVSYPLVIEPNSQKQLYSVFHIPLNRNQIEALRMIFKLEGKKGCGVLKRSNLLKLSYYVSYFYDIPCYECQFDLSKLYSLAYSFAFKDQNGDVLNAAVAPIMGLNRLRIYLKSKIDPIANCKHDDFNECRKAVGPCSTENSCKELNNIYDQMGDMIDLHIKAGDLKNLKSEKNE